MRNALIPIAASLALTACGSKTACSGLSDKDATARVIAEYGKLSAAEKGDPAQMQFSQARVVGIGSKGLIQLWFMQDDHTLTVATLAEDCQLQFRPGLAADSIQQAAIPVHKPKF